MNRILQTKLITIAAVSVLLTAEGSDDMVLIPEGEFIMGSDNGYFDESPAHKVYLPAYYIDRHEVTNRQFAEYVKASGDRMAVEGSWFLYSLEGCLDLLNCLESKFKLTLPEIKRKGGMDTMGLTAIELHKWSAANANLLSELGKMGLEPGDLSAKELLADSRIQAVIKEQSQYPVRGVSWRDASNFANWAGKRLPTEAEWEKAARGTDGRTYPWGNGWPETAGSPAKTVSKIDASPFKPSPYQCLGMTGNVWEWTADWYGEYYYKTLGERVQSPKGPKGLPNGQLPGFSSSSQLLRSEKQGRESDTRKVIRGGGFGGNALQAKFNFRCSRRLWSNPDYWHDDIGFRCAKNP
jgi:formylglycine-generating enzyme required for sulfatase activity